jgi:hypothetical protein
VSCPLKSTVVVAAEIVVAFRTLEEYWHREMAARIDRKDLRKVVRRDHHTDRDETAAAVVVDGVAAVGTEEVVPVTVKAVPVAAIVVDELDAAVRTDVAAWFAAAVALQSLAVPDIVPFLG